MENTEITLGAFEEMYRGRVGESGDIAAFFSLFEVLAEYNAKFNLTAIRTPEDFLSKHAADCIAAAEFIRPLIKSGSATLLDVGSGAGFPALPIAISLPEISVTALDSTAKKIAYITEAARRVGCANVTGITGRAEEIAADPAMRESFDFVTARAVARLNVLMELCAPFVKVGGYFIAMKGAQAAEEAAEAAHAVSILGFSAPEIRPYSLPMLDDSRAFVCCRKVSPTPDRYPRQYAKIVKIPL